jgi:Spy/CpxP family protein refolding chaperone
MFSNKIGKQVAIAAGFLALSFAPGMTRAQSASQPTAQDQTTQTQPAPAAPAKEDKKHGVMAGLNLTDDQKAQMKQIRESTKSQLAAVQQDQSLTADQQRTKIHELRHNERLQMVKLLTPEQRQQMKANVRAMRAARREKQQQAPQAQPQG